MSQQDEVAYWKAQARKHERRSKQAQRLARRLIAEIRVPSDDRAGGLSEIEAELDRLYAEKRTLLTGTGDPFHRPTPSDASPHEVIVARSSRKRTGPAVPVSHPPRPAA